MELNLATVATTGSYNDLSNKSTIPNDPDDLSDVDTTTIPTNGQVLKWLNNKWAPADDIQVVVVLMLTHLMALIARIIKLPNIQTNHIMK